MKLHVNYFTLLGDAMMFVSLYGGLNSWYKTSTQLSLLFFGFIASVFGRQIKVREEKH